MSSDGVLTWPQPSWFQFARLPQLLCQAKLPCAPISLKREVEVQETMGLFKISPVGGRDFQVPLQGSQSNLKSSCAGLVAGRHANTSVSSEGCSGQVEEALLRVTMSSAPGLVNGPSILGGGGDRPHPA